MRHLAWMFLCIQLHLQVSESDVTSCRHWKDLADFPAAQPPEADSANVPTQESWTSDRKQTQLSQGHYKSASPLTQVSPLPENLSRGLSLCFSQTNYLTNRHSSSPQPIFTLPALCPVSHHSLVLLQPLSNWTILLLGKRAMINSQGAFACTISGFHVEASVFLTLSEHAWLYLILKTSQMSAQ